MPGCSTVASVSDSFISNLCTQVCLGCISSQVLERFALYDHCVVYTCYSTPYSQYECLHTNDIVSIHKVG